MSGFVYGERKPLQTYQEQESELWEKRNAEISKRNLEKTKDMAPIPSMSEVYRARDSEIAKEQKQKRADIDNNPYSTQSFINAGKAGMALPRNDPYSKRVKWQAINPGVEYPGDEGVK